MFFGKSAVLAAAGTFALVAAPPVFSGSVGSAAQTAGPAYAQAQSDTSSQRRVQADTLLDQSVENADGETIGDIQSVLIDDNGEVAAVIVGVGGFLGMGERDVAIDWDDLDISGNGNTIQSNMTREQLEALPEYSYERAEQQGTAFNDPNYQDPRTTRERSEDRLAQQSGQQSAGQGQADNWSSADRFRVSHLIGANVVNANGEEIGEVEDVIMRNGDTDLVLAVGDFLGIGGESVTARLDQVEIEQQAENRDELRVSISMSEDDLRSLPKYQRDQRGQNGGN